MIQARFAARPSAALVLAVAVLAGPVPPALAQAPDAPAAV